MFKYINNAIDSLLYQKSCPVRKEVQFEKNCNIQMH